ncbi:MAG: HD domain-containing phosphohydrolase [Gammaproteobacteria bacterium]
MQTRNTQTVFSEKVLFVDDDPCLLEAMDIQFGRNFTLAFAEGGKQALEIIEDEGPFAVVVSDRRMPGMDGVELLSEIRETAPDTVRVMLTGDAHLQAAMDAVNQGEIFRFLTKPGSHEDMRMTLEAGIQQHRLVTSQKVLLGQTLQGSVKILTDMLSLIGTGEFANTAGLKPLVTSLADEMNASAVWEIEIAALLSSIGFVTVPPRVLRKVQSMESLSSDEQDIYEQHAKVGRDLIANIPRLENVAEIVLYQQKNYDGSGFPVDQRSGQEIPLGSRIIRVATDYNAWIARCSPKAAIARLRNSRSYDSAVIDALTTIVDTLGSNETKVCARKVCLTELAPGMTAASDIRTIDGSTLLVRKGQTLSPMLLQRIRNYHLQTPVNNVIDVLVPCVNGERNVRILIIDDTPIIHDDIKGILASNEASAELQSAVAAMFGQSSQRDSQIRYEVDSAMQGQEGLAKVVEAVKSERPYAVVFVDMWMSPGWDGIETIEHLRQEDPELEIVIWAVDSDSSWSEIIERLGHSDKLLILNKPFDTAEISQLAAALSEKWELAKQTRLKMSDPERMVDDRMVSLQEVNDGLQTENE